MPMYTRKILFFFFSKLEQRNLFENYFCNVCSLSAFLNKMNIFDQIKRLFGANDSRYSFLFIEKTFS